MVKKRDTAAVTRAVLDARLKAVMEDLRRTDLEPMKSDIRRLMLESVATNARITQGQDELRQEMRALGSSVTNQLETFTAKMETLWRESIVFPKLIDAQGATLRSHEHRLQALEAWRQMP